MKKFVGILVVILVLTTAMSLAETDKIYGNLLDYTFACDDDVKEALEKGENVYGSSYYYDYTLYCACGSLNATEIFGYLPEINELEDLLETKYKECGLKFPEVEIIRVGEKEKEPIYRVEIKTMTNLNRKFENEIGDCFIGEGLDYNWVVVLAEIH